MRPHKIVDVFVGCHCGYSRDTEHGKSGRSPLHDNGPWSLLEVTTTAPYDSAMDVTNVISLVAAVSAISAACFAFWSIYDDQRLRRREQANLVSGWVGRTDNAPEWYAIIRNQSALPVYNVRTLFREMEKLPNAPNAGFGWRDAGPAVQAPRGSTIRILPPETDRDVTVPPEFKWHYKNPTDRTCVVSISFTGAAGHDWQRNEHGMLILARWHGHQGRRGTGPASGSPACRSSA